MSDIDKAFNFLHDNIPQWFKDVAEIEKKIVAMQDELAKVPMASRALLKKRKSESIESLRDVDADMEDSELAVADQAGPLASRKRKTPSVSSEHASTAVKIKARSMVVVSYDGQLQSSFEQLVRAIGTGRNMLRKGKMAAKMEAMAALSADDDDDDDGSDDDNAILAKIGYRHRTGLASMRTRAAMSRPAPTPSTSTPVEVFDTVDKALENAQSLCEKAAHLSLREGDCRKELGIVRQHFTEVQEAATKEVAKIAERKEKEAQQSPQTDPEKPKIEVKPAPPLEPKSLLPVGLPPTTSPTHVVAQVIDIEVDDDDDDDTDFVMPPIRLTSRG